MFHVITSTMCMCIAGFCIGSSIASDLPRCSAGQHLSRTSGGCINCTDGIDFMRDYNREEECTPCRQSCSPMRLKEACTTIRDTICGCNADEKESIEGGCSKKPGSSNSTTTQLNEIRKTLDTIWEAALIGCNSSLVSMKLDLGEKLDRLNRTLSENSESLKEKCEEALVDWRSLKSKAESKAESHIFDSNSVALNWNISLAFFSFPSFLLIVLIIAKKRITRRLCGPLESTSDSDTGANSCLQRIRSRCYKGYEKVPTKGKISEAILGIKTILEGGISGIKTILVGGEERHGSPPQQNIQANVSTNSQQPVIPRHGIEGTASDSSQQAVSHPPTTDQEFFRKPKFLRTSYTETIQLRPV